MFVMMIHDDLIKSCVGKDYKRFAPYLLTVFFFIFINNIMGLIPIFPGGANVTGNIAITMVLALCTFVAVNLFGTREYWKEIFWPEVPVWLKCPVPMMPAIELVGIFTKPFALMIRLFANMMAGHAVILSLTCLVFVTVSMGPAVNGSMTVVSVLFCIFMNLLELLVAFIQAYVFTMLSAVFIGLARVEHHKNRRSGNLMPDTANFKKLLIQITIKNLKVMLLYIIVTGCSRIEPRKTGRSDRRRTRTAIGAGIGIGKIGGSAMEAIARQPEASNDIRTNMIIIAALVEGVALFAVVVCFLAL